MKIFQVAKLQDYQYAYAFFSTLKGAKDFVKKSVGFGYDKDNWFSDTGIWIYEGEPTYFIKAYEVDKAKFE